MRKSTSFPGLEILDLTMGGIKDIDIDQENIQVTPIGNHLHVTCAHIL